MFSCQGRIQNFFQGRGHRFSSLFKGSFLTDLFLSKSSNKNDSWGKFVIFLPLTLSASRNIMHFVRTVSIMCA